MAELRVLGPLGLWTGGRAVDLGSAKQQTVLAALVVDAGRLVPTETLIARVWDERPPPGARSALYSYLTGLRRALRETADADGAAMAVLRRSGGYLFDADPELVDVHRFHELVDRAYRLRSLSGRGEVLGRALDEWRGEPLSNLRGEWVARVRTGWQRLYVDTVVGWARDELAAGHATATLTRLTEANLRYPLAEPVVALLMRALVATGHGAEAIACFIRTRQLLVDQLGLDPGDELVRLHQSILRGEGVRPRGGPAPVPARLVVPAQLPMDTPRFVGRRDELRRLDRLLDPGGRAPAVPVCAISGTAGVGKTTLALHWAHRVAGRFPEGQLFVNLRGFDEAGSAMPSAEAVRYLLDALEVPPTRIPTSVPAQVGLYRSLLAGRRMLIVLDNARDADQVRPLLPGAPGCLVLVTSRRTLPGLIVGAEAHNLVLDVPDAAEARQLLASRLGLARAANEPEAVAEIVARCARLPLALAIVAARAAARPGHSLARLAEESRVDQYGLDALDGGDSATDVRWVFSWSYRALSPGAARLFRLLSLHPGPDVGIGAAAALAGNPPDQARSLLTELAMAHQVDEPAPGRFWLHDLLRAYAMELAGAVDGPTERRAAVHRMLDHYLRTAQAATAAVHQRGDRIVPPPGPPGVQPERLPTPAAALAWFAAELPVLLYLVDLAAAEGFDTHAWQLAWASLDVLDHQGRWREQVHVQELAVQAARRLDDRPGRTVAHNGLARAYARLGRYDDAYAHYQEALRLLVERGDGTGEAQVHLNLGWLLERQGRQAAALEQAQLALDRYRTADDRVGQARALNAIGWYYALLGDLPIALCRCEEALAIQVAIGDRRSQASTWDSLGYVYGRTGDHPRAIDCYKRAVELCREVGHRTNEAEILTHLGDACHAGGQLVFARDAWERALVILDEFAHPHADELRARLDAGTPAGSGLHFAV
jgi:DNA-binding SARP family transcriptional activator/tetratricopeptide (TPR) repeat protein